MVLSIITPVFNGAAYLEKCIINVASQWEDSIEHLVIDGESNDGSIEILENLSLQFPHLKWVSEKDKGQSDAMNKGIKLAKGQWISFLNVDDFYEDDILPKILKLTRLEENRNTLLTGNLNVWNEHGILISVNRPKGMSLALLLADICEWPFNPSAYFYPKKIHELIGYFPNSEHFAMDYDFFLKLMLQKIPIRYYDETWGNFRLLPNAKTGKDQADNSSYTRAKALREKYFQLASPSTKFFTRFYKLFWAVRNKIYGLLKA